MAIVIEPARRTLFAERVVQGVVSELGAGDRAHKAGPDPAFVVATTEQRSDNWAGSELMHMHANGEQTSADLALQYFAQYFDARFVAGLVIGAGISIVTNIFK